MKNDKIYHSWAKPAHWYWYRQWVLVPMVRGKVVPVPIKVVPVPILKKRVGTGADQSGIDIDASNRLDFCIRALISPTFVLR